MTPAARFSAVADLLQQIWTLRLPADQVMHRFLKESRFAGAEDRRVLQRWLFGFFRFWPSTLWRAGHCLQQDLQAPEHLRLLAGCFLVLKEHIPPETVASWCDGSPRHGAPPSDLETRAWSLVQACDPEAMPSGTALEIPPAWQDGLAAAFPESWADVAKAIQTEAAVDVRINTLKTDIPQGRSRLLGLFPGAVPTPMSPWGMRLPGRPSLTGCPLLIRGDIEIQDEGSQMAGLLVDARPGMDVLDLCAGAGGKTLALAASMNNQGQLFALDPAPGRIRRAQERLKRAGVFNTRCRVLDAEARSWLKRQKQRFDRVLLDVPCSGSGTWRRNPDLKWRMTPDDLKELTQIQKGILEMVAPLVKPGGLLVYVTCSFLPAENREPVLDFLSRHPDFLPEYIPDFLENRGIRIPSPAGSPFLQLDPFHHGTDGFFCAVLRKSADLQSPQKPGQKGGHRSEKDECGIPDTTAPDGHEPAPCNASGVVRLPRRSLRPRAMKTRTRAPHRGP